MDGFFVFFGILVAIGIVQRVTGARRSWAVPLPAIMVRDTVRGIVRYSNRKRSSP